MTSLAPRVRHELLSDCCLTHAHAQLSLALLHHGRENDCSLAREHVMAIYLVRDGHENDYSLAHARVQLALRASDCENDCS